MNAREQNIMDACLVRLAGILETAGLKNGIREDNSGHDFDCVYRLPEQGFAFLVQVRQSLQPYQVDGLVGRYRQWLLDSSAPRRNRLLVLATRIPPSTLEKCAEAGICALDEDGNGFLRIPALHYHKSVPHRRSISPSGTTRGIFSSKASRLARAMLARYPETWIQTRLAAETDVSESYVSRAVGKMIDADYVRRDKNKLRVVDPNRLLDDWAGAYRFDRHRRSRFGLAMGDYLQGLRKFQQEMERQNIRFAFTGWSAAYLRAPYGIPDSVVAYVDRLTPDIPFRVLHPVESKGNVLLLLPHDDGVFQFSQPSEFGENVADVQSYLDLRSLPGRAWEQAEVLRTKRLAFRE